MAKRLKLRICRAITTTWHSCRSKPPSILPQHPHLPSLNPDQTHRHRRRSPAFISIAAGACCLPISKQIPDDQEFKWQKEEKWHVVAKINYEQPTHRRKICSSRHMPPAPPPSSAEDNEGRVENKKKKKKKNKKKKKKCNYYKVVPTSKLRISTSSADSGWFSGGGGGEETETLLSSSLTDSSLELMSNRRNNRRGARNPAAVEVEIPAKVKESVAVVKRSEDPYEDFKNSMMEMIVEKHMFDVTDLEQLLQCFLCLNSRKYHGIIVQAFSDIWDAIFSPPPSSAFNRRRVASF